MNETFRNYALLSIPLLPWCFAGCTACWGELPLRRVREVAVLSKTGDQVAFYNQEYQRRGFESPVDELTPAA